MREIGARAGRVRTPTALGGQRARCITRHTAFDRLQNLFERMCDTERVMRVGGGLR